MLFIMMLIVLMVISPAISKENGFVLKPGEVFKLVRIVELERTSDYLIELFYCRKIDSIVLTKSFLPVPGIKKLWRYFYLYKGEVVAIGLDLFTNSYIRLDASEEIADKMKSLLEDSLHLYKRNLRMKERIVEETSIT